MSVNPYPSYHQGEDPNYDSHPNTPQIGKDKCSICLGRLENGIVHVTHVTQKIDDFYHSYHEACIRPWIDLGHDDCPLCRRLMERVVIIDSAKITEHREFSDKLTKIYEAREARRIAQDAIELDELEPLVPQIPPQEIEQLEVDNRFKNLCHCCMAITVIGLVLLGYNMLVIRVMRM